MTRNSILLSALMLLFSIGMSFSQRAFLKIGDIDGEATASGHEAWIVIESLSHALTQQQSTTGTSRRRGNVVLGDLVITKMVDKATPQLMELCAKGQVIPKVELDMVANNGRVFYKVSLENVLINRISTNSVCDPECILVNEVALQAAKVKWEYTDSRGRKVESTYDAQRGN
ncbi:MAG: type VI secretion system tube protein Hcp [Flavobacteriaceae bacterium]|nr:type VI secretion system tube protein Hcp [Bacteroidia bacterium]MBT8287638.1 type VI secretion system tube protein Hcp [Bacteroidia bacterium]NNF75547.1 type VI secretion system tube protein Hcp [Flavobacteriaceae bacterium]NNK73465.1 type VI secretion system tube protein Hcp [Flavobacteriaceae bacterium]